MDSTPAIAAIILQYGHWQKTWACVRSLLAGDMPPAWIIVVDNASPDDSADEISRELKTLALQNAPANPDYFVDMAAGEKPRLSAGCALVLVRMAKNRGYAAGNNAGLRMALEVGADALLILNNDTTVEACAVREMWQRLSSSPRPGLCGPLIVYTRDGSPVQCLGGGRTNHVSGLSRFAGAGLSLEEARKMDAVEVEKNLNFICGACVMASREFVQATGLMDEGFFLYCEEQDWAIRSANRFDFVWAKNAIVHHHEGATTGWSRYDFNLRGAFLLMRARFRLTWKHFPQYLPSVALCLFFAAGRLGLRKLAVGLNNALKLNTKRNS